MVTKKWKPIRNTTRLRECGGVDEGKGKVLGSLEERLRSAGFVL